MHHTKDKGDLAVAKTIVDLIGKGYQLFTALITEHSRFDLVAYKDDKFYRIQCKYNSNNHVENCTSWSNTKGTVKKKYMNGDFDYFAVYFPDIDRTVYPSIKFAGCNIATQLPNSPTPFYWWEDFKEFTDVAVKKSYEDFNYTITTKKRKPSDHLKARKIEWPSKEDLEKLVWEKPTTELAKQFGVSDKAIGKWCKKYNISKPARGYWSRIKTNKYSGSSPTGGAM